MQAANSVCVGPAGTTCEASNPCLELCNIARRCLHRLRSTSGCQRCGFHRLTQKPFVEMNVSCLERGGTVCSQREGEGVTEAMRKHKPTVGWLPQLRVDPLEGEVHAQLPGIFVQVVNV